MLRQQFTAAEWQKLAELMLEQKPKAGKPKKELPSVAEDLREAFLEVKQADQGQKQFRSLTDVLNELQG